MSLRSWLGLFVTSGALAWSVLDGGIAAAQQPTPPVATPTQPGNTVPRLPETEVVAEPPAPNLTPNFQPFQPTPSILTANAFQPGGVAGYQATSSTTGSLIDMPKILYPGSVDTITQQMRHDQQIINVDDVIRDIAGAVKANGNGGDGVRRPDQFIVRGFELTSENFRKNGFLDPTNTPRDFANIERIDILKGPASIVYGSALPSGTFNVITKRAQQDRFVVGTAQVGSFDFQRFTVDANNMNQAGDILFRVNAAHQQGNSFRGYGSNERTFVAPTFTVLLDDDTFLVYEAEFNNDRRQYDTGLTAINGNTRALPSSRFLGNSGNFLKSHDYRNTLSLTHNINDDWSFYLGGSSLFYDQQLQGDQPGFAFATGSINPTTGFYNAAGAGIYPDLPRRQFTGGQSGQNQALIANLNGNFDGPLFEHNLVVGTEQDWRFQHANFGSTDPRLIALDPTTNLLAVDPTLPGPFGGFVTNPPVTFAFNGLYQSRHSVYFQDLVTLSERWKVLYGARYDHVGQTSDFTIPNGFGGTASFFSKNSFDQGTPRVGLIFEAVPDALSFYSMYTSSFNPVGGAAFGLPLPGANTNPELGQIFESGFKANIFDNLTYTFSAFNIYRQNVAVQPDSGIMYAQADQRSKGIEMTLVGQWTERMSTISNYSYTDVKQRDTTNDPLYNINGRVRGVPFNLANVWTRYNFIQERDRTFGAALGWVYVGDRRGDYGGAFGSPLRLDSYNRWDIGLFARKGRFDSAGYLENVFNARYETGSLDQYQIFPGAPVNFRLQAGITF
ncbi:MAG: TonB-dependent siderophore receptor [Planctomycetia bacterium]|nr:TonB-dependent siderophore receptor [Planctomycetia bacterium]